MALENTSQMIAQHPAILAEAKMRAWMAGNAMRNQRLGFAQQALQGALAAYDRGQDRKTDERRWQAEAPMREAAVESTRARTDALKGEESRAQQMAPLEQELMGLKTKLAEIEAALAAPRGQAELEGLKADIEATRRGMDQKDRALDIQESEAEASGFIRSAQLELDRQKMAAATSAGQQAAAAELSTQRAKYAEQARKASVELRKVAEGRPSEMFGDIFGGELDPEAKARFLAHAQLMEQIAASMADSQDPAGVYAIMLKNIPGVSGAGPAGGGEQIGPQPVPQTGGLMSREQALQALIGQ